MQQVLSFFRDFRRCRQQPIVLSETEVELLDVRRRQLEVISRLQLLERGEHLSA